MGSGLSPLLRQFSTGSVVIALLAATSTSATADAVWSGSAPVFQSDVARQQQQLEAEREQRRQSYAPTTFPRFMEGGPRPDITPQEPEIVGIAPDEKPGTIIIDTSARTLYYVLPGARAYKYPISVGRDGFTWTGTKRVTRVAAWPSWTPPPEMRARQPGLPITVSGGINNPLGAKSLYLGSTLYRIHGTNNPRSIGRASSSGCFRMLNEHVVHLATLAKVGTVVKVMRTFDGERQLSVWDWF